MDQDRKWKMDQDPKMDEDRKWKMDQDPKMDEDRKENGSGSKNG